MGHPCTISRISMESRELRNLKMEFLRNRYLKIKNILFRGTREIKFPNLKMQI